MNCPVCENHLVEEVCPQCGTVFDSADFDKLRHLDYLLRVTADWTAENLVERRERYAAALAEFRSKWKAEEQEAISDPLSVTRDPLPAGDGPQGTGAAVPSQSPAPSFDQWLFSERTIKSALYSGAFLLILAGLIFVGANWSKLPGIGKLGVTLATTALMLGSGFRLLRRSETLRVGGLALLGIAAGFAPLNFYVADEYLLNLDDYVMWLIGSVVCTLFYVWLLRQTQSAIFGLFTGLGMLSGQIALYAMGEIDGTLAAPLIMLLPVPLLAVALWWRTLREVFRPIYTLAHILALPIFAGMIFASISGDIGLNDRWTESHWWLVLAVLMGVAFYFVNFRVIGSQLSEAAAAGAFALGSIALTNHLVGVYAISEDIYEINSAPFGIAYAVLMAIYLAAGFALERYRLWLHGTALLLSLFAASLTWDTPQVATIVLLVIALAYVIAAMWYRIAPPIVPALLALYGAVWAFWQIDAPVPEATLIISYAVLGVVLMGVALWFRRKDGLTGLILMVAGGVTLLGVFVWSVSAENLWLAVWLSLTVALIAFGLTWIEREWLLNSEFGFRDNRQIAFPGFLTVIGASALFIGHFSLMAATSENSDGAWPLITIGVSAAFVLIGLLLRSGQLGQLFGLPLNLTGFATMLVPLTFAFEFDWWVVAVVCGVIGAVAIVDGAIRRSSAHPIRYYQIVVGVGFLIAAYWALLSQYKVEEGQAYALPLGIILLLFGWLEQRQNRPFGFMAFTLFGLLVLFGSALDQSFDAVRYALLLLVESVIAIAIGVQMRSRLYVQIGLLALIVNGLVQYGPAFADLPRFGQIGLVGSTLLILGMLALFRREQLLATREAWQAEWREWNA